MNASKQSDSQPAAKQESAASAAPQVGGFAVLGQRFGNANLGRMLQTKLTVSGPQDRYEQEADRVADQVMRMAEPEVRTQSQPISTVQRTEESGAGVPTVDASTESAISSLSGRGNPLPQAVRSFMEPRFNADFSSVRVHTDGQAHDLARSVSAQAFTVGNNVVFGAGHYSPDTEGGKRLLAHELTHVVQQVPGRVSRAPLGLTRESEALFGLDKADPVAERPPPLEHWLETGPLYAGGLTYTQVQGSIDEIEQFLGRQNSSSFKASRLEDALTLLRKELQRQEDATRQDKKKQKLKRGKAAGKAPRPERYPRILLEKSSTAYPNPADMRREYNLIMQWLAVPDLLRRDRQILEFERANLKPQLDQDRAQQNVERHAVRVRQALTPQAQSESAFLISLARTVQGIGKDPGNEAVSYIYDHGERVAIGTPQAADLRKKVAEELKHAARRIETNAYGENERYDLQKKIDHDAPRRAWIAGLLGRSDDPGEEVYDRYFRTLTLLRVVEEELKKGDLVKAASHLPRMEALKQEIKHLSKGFQDAQIRGAERAVTALEVTRDVSFAIAGSIAAIVAAPVIAGAAGAAGLGGFGSAVVATGGTGLLVGTGTAAVRSGSAVLGSVAAGEDARHIKRVALAEAKRGFREGFISGAGGGLSRGVATALGVGTKVGFQTARRLAADALTNGMTSMVDTLWQGGSIADASEAALRGMLVGLPGSALAGVNNSAVRYALAPMVIGATNYVAAIQAGLPPDQALKQATIAMTSHALLTGAKHDQALDARLKQKGEAVGRSVKRVAGTVKRRIGDVAAATAISLAEPLPNAPVDARPSPALVAGADAGAAAPTPSPVPTPDPVQAPTPAQASAPALAPAEQVPAAKAPWGEYKPVEATPGSIIVGQTRIGEPQTQLTGPVDHHWTAELASNGTVNPQSTLRALRQSGTVEGAAAAKLISTGRRNLNLLPSNPQGGTDRGGWQWGSNTAEVYWNRVKTPTEAAGVTAHEVKHTIDQPTPQTYNQEHEVAAETWGRAVDPQSGGSSPREVKQWVQEAYPDVAATPGGKEAPEANPKARRGGGDEPESEFENAPTLIRLPRLKAIVFKGGVNERGEPQPDHVIFAFNGEAVYLSSGTSYSPNVAPGEPNVRTPGEPYGFWGAAEEQSAMGPLGWVMKKENSQRVLQSFPKNYVYEIEAVVDSPKAVNDWLRANGAEVYRTPFEVGGRPASRSGGGSGGGGSSGSGDSPRLPAPDLAGPTQDVTPSTPPSPPRDADRTIDAPVSPGHTLPGGATRDGPPPRVPVLEHPASDPVFTQQHLLGQGQNKSAFLVKRVVVLTPHDPERWTEINLQLSMLKDLRTLANGALAKYVVPSFGPFELQGRYVMVEPQLGEGSRSIVAPEAKGKGWFVKGRSKFLNQQSIDDIRAINALLKQHRIDIDDRQYLIDTDGHVYLADPGSVRSAEPNKGYDAQDDMLIEIAKQNISAKEAKADTFKIGDTLQETAGRPGGLALPDPSAPLRPEDFPGGDPFGIEEALRAPETPLPGFRPNLTDPSKPLRPEDFADPVREPDPPEPQRLPRVLWWDGRRWRR